MNTKDSIGYCLIAISLSGLSAMFIIAFLHDYYGVI